jgi:hypothetical protein
MAPERAHVVAEERFVVGVVVEKRKLDNPWVDYVWLPSGILPGVPSASPGTILAQEGDVTRVYAGPYEMSLHSIETANYLENLQTGRPRIWISIRETSQPAGIQVAGVTADPAEGESFTEAGSDTVETVAMPAEILERVAAFVAEYHVERQFFKRKRDSKDTSDDD